MHRVIFKDSNIDLLNRIKKLTVHWVSRSLVLFPPDKPRDYRYSIIVINDIDNDPNQHAFYEIPLGHFQGEINPQIKNAFPHLAHFIPFTIDENHFKHIPDCLRHVFFAVIRDNDDNIVDASGIQIPGVLDDLYPYEGELGVHFQGAIPTICVWSPTAKSITLNLYDQALNFEEIESLPMNLDALTGVWSLTLSANYIGKYYLYEVTVFCPSTGRFETNNVTDPYSVSLSTNSKYSQIFDLQSTSLKPTGWDILVKPRLDAAEDIVIYELHTRDFSASDQTVEKQFRGTFKAFTEKNSDGMNHLKALSAAGLTHIHLLPAFDIASVNEDKRTWKEVDEELLRAYPPNSDLQAQTISAIQDEDGYNWGYDPFHFMAPEGSYSTDPDGPQRILEFREMVVSLNQTGLRLVMDMVFNHTFDSGLDEASVFDKIVPGYYYRLNFEGKVENSTCCSNTASEHKMMGKLMVDAVLLWAKAYKVDGFRFDLMGHHMLADMQRVRAALDTLTIEKDGVDGKKIYMYGEAWDFGEVANNNRGINASIRNIGGSGIGVFNDRARDALRGGSAFSGIFDQGFATGLYSQANHEEHRNHEHQKWVMFEYCDLIKVGLAGNLKDFRFTRAGGEEVTADQIWYNDQPAGFTRNPSENIIYLSAHDNESFWDILQVKSPGYLTVEERVRLNNLGLSVVALSQGVPFFFGGEDLLRSKSLDRDSYNSGDWFNQIDWSYNSNNWGKGLPIKGRDKWFIFSHLLADESRKPTRKDILFAAEMFRMFLAIRKSSLLFRLRDSEHIKKCLTFLNNGPHQIPGLIVMKLDDRIGLDPKFSSIIVLFNSNPGAVYFGNADLLESKYKLHPTQLGSSDELLKKASFDPDLGEFVVPARTTAVFVLEKSF